MLLFIGVGATAEEFEPGGDMSRLVIGVGKDRVGANDRDHARCDNRKNESGGSGNSAPIVLTRRHSSTKLSPRRLMQRHSPTFPMAVETGKSHQVRSVGGHEAGLWS